MDMSGTPKYFLVGVNDSVKATILYEWICFAWCMVMALLPHMNGLCVLLL